MAIGLDWLYPALTPAQRLSLVNALEQQGLWIWPETNPSRQGAWGTDSPGSNYFVGFLVGSWMAGLSLWGENPNAALLLNVSRQKQDTMLTPYLAGWGKGGHWPEDGSSYGAESTTLLFQAWEANRTATGEDLFAALPWGPEAVTATIHGTTPDRNRRWPWGDQSRSSPGWLDDMDRMGMLIASRFDSRAAVWCDSISPDRNQQRVNMWADPLYYHAPTPGGP
jgi:hypothetical protein